MVLGWAPALALLLTTSLSALGSIFILAAVQRRERDMDGRIFAETDGGTRYLFDGETLLDATPSARALLAHGVGGTAWSALLSIMARSFPDIEARLSHLETLGVLTLVSDDPAQPSVTLTAELRGGLTRGTQMRLSGKGDAGPGGNGDAIVSIEVGQHRFFTRDGDDVRLDLPVTLAEAVLGGKVKVPTVEDAVMLTVPAGTTSGKVLRIKGKGFHGKGGGRGDQLVTLMVDVPAGDAALERFAADWNAGERNPRAAMGV